jgi:hypothetical protein
MDDQECLTGARDALLAGLRKAHANATPDTVLVVVGTLLTIWGISWGILRMLLCNPRLVVVAVGMACLTLAVLACRERMLAWLPRAFQDYFRGAEKLLKGSFCRESTVRSFARACRNSASTMLAGARIADGANKTAVQNVQNVEPQFVNTVLQGVRGMLGGARREFKEFHPPAVDVDEQLQEPIERKRSRASSSCSSTLTEKPWRSLDIVLPSFSSQALLLRGAQAAVAALAVWWCSPATMARSFLHTSRVMSQRIGGPRRCGAAGVLGVGAIVALVAIRRRFFAMPPSPKHKKTRAVRL